MLKRVRNKRIFIFVIILIIITGIILILIIYNKEQKRKLEILSIDYFYDNKISKNIKLYDYIAVLEIPKINLKKGLFSIQNKENNVNKNITIFSESTFPDQEESNLILMGHSGNGNVSYFKKIYLLDIDDEVIVYYKKVKYTYKIIKYYEQNKTGSITIYREKLIKSLTIITCKNNDEKKQIVFLAWSIKEEPY